MCRVTPKEQHLQFSKAPIMSNFGELPFGEIPEPLKFVRPFRKLKLQILDVVVLLSLFASSNVFLIYYNRDDYSFKWHQSCTEKTNHQTASLVFRWRRLPQRGPRDLRHCLPSREDAPPWHPQPTKGEISSPLRAREPASRARLAEKTVPYQIAGFPW